MFNKIIIYLFYSTSILHAIYGDKDFLLFLRIAQLFGLISFLRVLGFKGRRFFESKAVFRSNSFKILVLSLIGAFIIGIINTRYNFLSNIYPLSFFGVSWLICYIKPRKNVFILISLATFSLLFYYYLSGVNPTEWVKGSRNHVSVLALYITIVPLLIHLLNNGKASLLLYIVLPFLCFMLSVFAVGRSGIVTSFLLLGGNIFLYYKNHKHKFKILLLYSSFIILIFYFLLPNFQFFLDSYLYKFTTREFALEDREDIIELYLNKMDFLTSFFSINSLEMISKNDLTLHNSYLHWHFAFGVFGLFILFISLKSLVKLFKINKIYFLILAVVLLRSFTDQILFSEGILLGLPFLLIISLIDFKFV